MITWRDEVPYNADYSDVYYSAENGLEESRHVYLEGIGLAGLSRRRQTLVRIGELGFGTGLNFLATAQQWPADSPVLHYVSIEKHPLSAEDIQRALQQFPQITELALRLKDTFTTRLSGLQRCWFADNILLDIWFDDVAEVLPKLEGAFDAWYLDGFSPRTNPEMFSSEVCQHLARLSVMDTRVATFSVAGMVRRNLTESGFSVTKAPGFGRKGQCLQAQYNRQKEDFCSNTQFKNIAIIGAGIAGASCAEQCRRLGHEVHVFGDSASFASEVPVAAVAPRLAANQTKRGYDIARCFAYAVQYYRQYPKAILSEGAIKIPSAAFSLPRLQSACTSWRGLGIHAPKICSAAEASILAQTNIDTEIQYLPTALSIDTAKLRKLLLHNTERIIANISAYYRDYAGWILSDSRGRSYSGFDALVIAAGTGLRNLVPALVAETQAKSGVIQHFSSDAPPAMALGGWGGHLLPIKDGFWMSNGTEVLTRWNIRGQEQQTWSGEKLSVRGHWPVSGAVTGQDGLYVLAGAGGHGYTLMPFLASDLALKI